MSSCLLTLHCNEVCLRWNPLNHHVLKGNFFTDWFVCSCLSKFNWECIRIQVSAAQRGVDGVNTRNRRSNDTQCCYIHKAICNGYILVSVSWREQQFPKMNIRTSHAEKHTRMRMSSTPTVYNQSAMYLDCSQQSHLLNSKLSLKIHRPARYVKQLHRSRAWGIRRFSQELVFSLRVTQLSFSLGSCCCITFRALEDALIMSYESWLNTLLNLLWLNLVCQSSQVKFYFHSSKSYLITFNM